MPKFGDISFAFKICARTRALTLSRLNEMRSVGIINVLYL